MKRAVCSFTAFNGTNNTEDSPMGKQVGVFDSNGRQIDRGAIVGISDEELYPWHQFQGFVVEPLIVSDTEGEGDCVGVFFATEVDASHFSALFSEIGAWDGANEQSLKTSDFGFLLDNGLWKTCPRVVLFQPGELVVQDGWGIVALAERMFPTCLHTVYDLPKGVLPNKAPGYMCFLDGCKATATRMALFNVWGSVCPMYVCDGCFPNTNGFCGDSLPKLKEHFLLAGGSRVPAL